MTTSDTIVVDTANYLQAINRAITGVMNAPTVDLYPTVIDTAALPLAMSWPSDGEFFVKGGAARESIRIYRVMVFVSPVDQSDTPSRAQLGMLLLQRFNDAYVNVTNTHPADPPPYQLTIESGPTNKLSDTGLDSNLTFGGKAYTGFQLHIRVRAWWTS